MELLKKDLSKFEKITVDLPTEHGDFKLLAINNDANATIVLFKGDLNKNVIPLIRVHSECMTGDVFGSKRCDCGPQLDFAMKLIAKEGIGAVIYLRQEGRGIGLYNKMRAYYIQQQGYDTVEANRELGFADDDRDYTLASDIIKYFGVEKIRMITNNPLKVDAMIKNGIEVVERVPIEIKPNIHNISYLATKKSKMGHILIKLKRGSKNE